LNFDLVEITADPIAVDALLEAVQGPEAGAVVLFLGTVREATSGRPVESLEYEAYGEMARSEIQGLIAEARQRWQVARCSVIHRYGLLRVGEISVAIAVSSPHRDAAFQAARYLIDTLKERAPIWKKERFADGEAAWVQGS
jgi:molybdopterin synthase catalytic subunit